MALEKITSVDLIEIVQNGTIQVRTKTAILEDGKHISGTFDRHTIFPGGDYSQEIDLVQSICKTVHTSEVIEAYAANQGEI
jgi:hypothetical protein